MHHKPTDDYPLSQSFRFGPVLAQCAENTVHHNEQRLHKRVIAHHVERKTTIHIVEDTLTQSNRRLANVVMDYLKVNRDPAKLVVLGRLFSQMNGIELEFLVQGIPYRVEGGAPFLARNEIVKLLMYPRLAQQLRSPLTDNGRGMILGTANTPNRMVRRRDLEDVLTLASRNQISVRQALESCVDPLSTPFGSMTVRAFEDYIEALTILASNREAPAGETLEWLVEFLDFDGHFDDYYGNSEAAEDRKRAVHALCEYAHISRLSLVDFVNHIDKLDTTQGKPATEQILLTSIHRVKGLEFDVVIIPDCIEGYIPCLVDNDNLAYDTRDKGDSPSVQYTIDAERRLFYVAITRAKEALYIGTVPRANDRNAAVPSDFLDEMALDITQRAFDAWGDGDTEELCYILDDANTPKNLV
ncbi:MAG: ATP-dependent helicase, partial [Chloroflexota bacterium]